MPYPHALKKKEKEKEKEVKKVMKEKKEKNDYWNGVAEGMGMSPYAGGIPCKKRDKIWLIWVLCAMGRRQKDSKVVSTCVIKHKAVGSWDVMGQREVGEVQ